MSDLEGKTVEVRWNGTVDVSTRYRLLKTRPDIGFVKLCDERSGADLASFIHGGFWVEIEAIKEIRPCSVCSR